MSEELKPCPFCGSRETEFIWCMAVNHIPFEGYIECKSCETSGPKAQATDDESSDCETRAIAAWNTRHIPEGYTLVPVEPTDKMIANVKKEWEGSRHIAHRIIQVYKAMIAAAQESE